MKNLINLDLFAIQLYTAPGLSIHCMQVHKEAIDKVPNSLPNRSNIEIEIYGMEGIPAQDLKDHERQKSGNGNKAESDDNMVHPGMAAQFPMMMPSHFQMMPGIQMMPHMMPRPIFPSAVASSAAPQKPTFPAYSK
jgi:hypothetical protein